MVDAILVERASRGDMDAFGEIYAQVYGKCVKHIRGMCKDEPLAEQVVQETVVHFMENDFRALKNLQDYSKLDSYFFSAATNHFRNIYKRGKTKTGDVREVFVDEIYDVDEDARLDRYFGVSESMTPEQLVEHQEIKDILMSMVDELPDTQKEAFNLFVIGEMKQTQIATIMDVPLNTVKSYLQYAKKKLHKKIEDYEKKTGTKLHSMVPILPFLRLIYASEEIMRPDLSTLLASAGTAAATGTAGIGAASAASAGSGTAAASVGGGTAAASVATGTAAASSVGASTTTGAAVVAGAAAKVGGGLVTKVVAGVLAAAVVGTGAVVVPKLVDNTPVDEPVINDTVIIQPEDHNGEIDLNWLDEELRPAVTSVEVDPALGVEKVQFIKERYAEMQTLLQKDYTFMQDDGYTAWYESADGYQKGVSGDPTGDHGDISIYKEGVEYYTEMGVSLISCTYIDFYTFGELEMFTYQHHGPGLLDDIEEYYGDRKINVTNVLYTYIPMYTYAYEAMEWGYQEDMTTSYSLRKGYSFAEDGTVIGVNIHCDDYLRGQHRTYYYVPKSYGETSCVLSLIAITEGGRMTEYTVDGTVKSVRDIPELAM